MCYVNDKAWDNSGLPHNESVPQYKDGDTGKDERRRRKGGPVTDSQIWR